MTFEFVPGEEEEFANNLLEGLVCKYCSSPLFFDSSQESTLPGQVYSDAGVREFFISGCCEHCLDGMFLNE